MAKEKEEEKEFTVEGWKPNKIFEKIIKDASTYKDIIEYVDSTAFTDKDYIDVMSGMYKEVNPYDHRDVYKILHDSKHNTPINNDKAIDFLYDVLDYKRKWNESYPKSKVSLRDHVDNINSALKYNNISSKKIHELVSDPKYMLENIYNNSIEPPIAILKNNQIKPEHLYKFLANHPSHINDVINHNQADSRLEDLIFDNPEHLKNLTGSNISNYLYNHLVRKEGQEPRYDISGKRAKAIVEHAHDKIYNDDLFSLLNSMDPEDKKDFVDRKLGIKGGRRFDNVEETEDWANWDNGEEYSPQLAKRLASSPHLSDNQAEHIKRHGAFDEKYNLYHNENVDPKHGTEMFKLWHDNAEHRGYSAEQLQDAYKKKKDDVYTIEDIDQDLINEDDLVDVVDEATRESYDFDNWVSDNEDDLLKEIKLYDEDYEKIDEKLRDEYSDWSGENPKFNKELDDNYQKLIDAAEQSESGTVNMSQVPEITGKHPKNLFIAHLGDENGNITPDELEEHSKEENPEEIDYSSHDDYSIDEHPEYDERFNEIAEAHKKERLREDPYHFYDDWYEDYMSSDEYQEAWQENMREAKEQAAKEHFNELYNYSHQDDRFIPEHLHEHIPELQEIKKARLKKKIFEPAKFLNKHIPQRSYEHPYGDDQHLHELLKDYADANGGSIDIGRMHKLMPNQGDVWKKIFGPKGKITSDEIQNKINDIKKTPYAISYGKWDGDKMQNINNRDQVIFRLDHTDESLKPLQEDPELFNTFKKVQEVSKRSGHPTNNNTIAWARVDTTDPKHWMIDEVQSDFGKTVTQYLKENNENTKAGHVQKISDYHKNWREALINHIIKEAKKHDIEKISTHSPESKASHTGAGKAHSVYQDSYKKIPRRMGFKPAPAQTLPVTEKTREGVFNRQPNNNKKELMEHHTDAWNHHKSWANAYNELFEMWSADPNANETRPVLLDKTKQYADYHANLAERHGDRSKQYGQKHENISIFPIVPSGSDMLIDASQHLRQDTHSEHSADKNLENPPVDFSKQDYHEGHTYNIKPNLVKSLNYRWFKKIKTINNILKIEISLPDEEIDLDKSEFYSPNKEGEKHPTKPYVAKMHPDTGLAWHHNDELAQKNDSIINDPKMRQRLLQKIPTKAHREAMEALINRVAKDPNRHFVPSMDGGRDKMRARHIKSLILSPESAKIDLSRNNALSISIARHGTHGGFSTWNYSLIPKKVVKNEQDGLKKYEQGRDFEINERVFFGRDSREYGRSNRNIKKTQHRAGKYSSDGNTGNISGKHLQKLELLMKGAAKRLFPFNPWEDISQEHSKEVRTWALNNPLRGRTKIPRLEGNARARALLKLHKDTTVKRHPETGERMFLLHRGMDKGEHSWFHGENNQSTYMKGTRTSWTPHYHIAKDFAENYYNDVEGNPGKVVSAWVPESEILTSVKQVVPTENNAEHEIIVNHQTPHPHASQKIVDQLEGKTSQKPPKLNKNEKNQTELLYKGDFTNKIKAGITGLAIAANVASPMLTTENEKAEVKPIVKESQKPVFTPKEHIPSTKDRILNSIMDVESSGGVDVNHERTPQNSIHRGERAYGKYALMPITIRETVKKHPDLLGKHPTISALKGPDLHNYMDKHPELEKEITSRHYDRLAKIFGHNPEKIARAWIGGIEGTKQAINNGEDISSHWHVRKVKTAYDRRKKKTTN